MAVSTALPKIASSSILSKYIEGNPDNKFRIYDSTKVGIGIQGALTGIANVYNAISARKVYSIYKKQEQMFIEQALLTAEREQLQGDIAMVSLRAEHAAHRGRNTLAVAAAGGNLSGSFLDKLMQNYQYNVMDERSQSLQTVWKVSNTKMEGYNKAISTASKAASAAYAQRDSAINSFLNFMSSSTKGVLEDLKQQEQLKYRQETEVNQAKKLLSIMNQFDYGSKGIDELNILKFEDSNKRDSSWSDISIS